MSRRRVASQLVWVACALTAAGCAEDESPQSYATKANAICREVVARFPERSQIDPGSAAADRGFRKLVRARGNAISELRRLKPPADARASASTMLRQLGKSQRLLEQAARLREGEMVLPTLIAAAKERELAERAARSLGLDACARL